MKKIISITIFLMGCMHADEPDIVMAHDGGSAQKGEYMRIYGGIVAAPHDAIQKLMQIVKLNIERSQQFKLDLVSCSAPKYKKDINDLFQKGYPLLLFIDALKNQETLGIEWRLYDATQSEMIKGKKQAFNDMNIVHNAHVLCDTLWPELLGGQRAPFLTRLAYIKRGKNRFGKKVSHLCTNDWLGHDEHILLSSSRILVAPTWYTGPDAHEQLFFSEFTPSNVRCMKLTKKGDRLPIFDFDGTCVGLACAPDGKTAVYCRSGALWKYSYDADLKRGIHERIVKRDQPCTHPSLLSSGEIIFCYGGALCRLDTAKNIHMLTHEGYCVAPDVHEKEQKIVYSKRIKGVMQLMVGDLVTGEHEQITFDAGDKIDPRWSPCGLYIVFCQEKGRGSTICIIHRSTRASYYITDPADHCSYPSWSSYGLTW